METLKKQGEAWGVEKWVTTAKDGAKLAGWQAGDDILILEVELTFLENEGAFWDLIFSASSREGG